MLICNLYIFFREMSVQIFCPFFNWVFYSLTIKFKSFVHFGYNSLIRYMFYIYFLPIYLWAYFWVHSSVLLFYSYSSTNSMLSGLLQLYSKYWNWIVSVSFFFTLFLFSIVLAILDLQSFWINFRINLPISTKQNVWNLFGIVLHL